MPAYFGSCLTEQFPGFQHLSPHRAVGASFAIWQSVLITRGFPGGSEVKNPPAKAGATGDAGSSPGSRKIPCRRKWQPILAFLPGVSMEEEPGGLQSIEWQSVLHNWACTNTRADYVELWFIHHRSKSFSKSLFQPLTFPFALVDVPQWWWAWDAPWNHPDGWNAAWDPLPIYSDLTASARASRGFQCEARPEKHSSGNPIVLKMWSWSSNNSTTWKLAKSAHSQAQAYWAGAQESVLPDPRGDSNAWWRLKLRTPSTLDGLISTSPTSTITITSINQISP